MEKRHGWVLATFLQRLAAYVIDMVLSTLQLFVLLLALGLALFAAVEIDGSKAWGNGGLRELITVIALGSLAVFVGYAAWWLFALRRGQTPGKQMVGIRVIKSDGEPSGWGHTFLRELLIKGLVGGFLSGMTGGIYWVVDHLWPLFDSDSQALHDKMVDTLVVRNRR